MNRFISTQSIRIEHPESSYGIFCFNVEGDLFLQSDWGFWGYSWRSFGDNFEDFLSTIDAEYVVQKFQNNQFSQTRKAIPKEVKMHLCNLFNEFKKALELKPGARP